MQLTLRNKKFPKNSVTIEPIVTLFSVFIINLLRTLSRKNFFPESAINVIGITLLTNQLILLPCCDTLLPMFNSALAQIPRNNDVSRKCELQNEWKGRPGTNKFLISRLRVNEFISKLSAGHACNAFAFIFCCKPNKSESCQYLAGIGKVSPRFGK